VSILSKVAKGLNYVTGSASTKFAINRLIEDYGKIIELAIDGRNKKVIISILLRGETLPIEVRIDEYEIIKTDLSTSVIVKNASSDKVWLNAILKNVIVGKPWDVKNKGADFLNDILG